MHGLYADGLVRAVCEWMGDVLPIAMASDESRAKERSKSEGG